MSDDRRPVRGRGTGENPANRFEHSRFELDPDDGPPEDRPAPATQFFRDSSAYDHRHQRQPRHRASTPASIPIAAASMAASIATPGPTHEYLGFSAGLDFETKIMVKEDAPELLRRELSSPEWKPQDDRASAASPMPISRSSGKLQLTRRCLEVLAEFRNPVVHRHQEPPRDARPRRARRTRLHTTRPLVFLSVTTLDADLARRLEPRASPPHFRLEAIEALAASRDSGGSARRTRDPGPDRPRDPRDPRGLGQGREPSPPASSRFGSRTASARSSKTG